MRVFQFPFCILLGFASFTSVATPPQTGTIVVPHQAAVLLRPVLDELARYRSEDGRNRHAVDAQFCRRLIFSIRLPKP
jgi:hypothetical protein